MVVTALTDLYWCAGRTDWREGHDITEVYGDRVVGHGVNRTAQLEFVCYRSETSGTHAL